MGFRDDIAQELLDFGVDLLLAIGVFALGYALVHFVILKAIRRVMRRYGVDRVFIEFATTILNILLMILVAILALDTMGINTGFLVAALIAVLLALAAAMQGWLQNVAAGLWMFLNQPFRLDDLVAIAGQKGRVEEISMLTTKLRTRDNLEVILPNRMIVSNVILNYHARETRRIELVISISYEDDVRRAIEVIEGVVSAEKRILNEPEPIVAVANLGVNGVDLDVRPWVRQEDFIATRYALREEIKYALEASGITLPYPQLQVHTNKAA